MYYILHHTLHVKLIIPDYSSHVICERGHYKISNKISKQRNEQ